MDNYTLDDTSRNVAPAERCHVYYVVTSKSTNNGQLLVVLDENDNTCCKPISSDTFIPFYPILTKGVADNSINDSWAKTVFMESDELIEMIACDVPTEDVDKIVNAHLLLKGIRL